MDGQKTNAPKVDGEEILDGIRQWVEIETPTYDGEAVNKLADVVEESMRALGAAIERTPGRDGFGDILTTRTPWGGDGPGILVLSHLDTVHPTGSLEDYNPWRREGDSVYGPGIYDMKAGAYLAYYAYQHLVRSGRETPLPVTFLYVPEEEIGSPTSRALIEAEAKKHKYVLVTEPAREGGKIVTGRKGVGRYYATARGVAAHSGSRHADGRSAIKAMAKLILEVEAMTDYEIGVTTNVGLVNGGTGVNVVPRECTAEIDLRIPTAALAEEYERRILGLATEDPDVELTVTGGINRPPYQKDAGIQKLFDHAKAVCAEVGFELQDMHTGGGSDGCFTAALGIPTLDGLGADGVGAHAQHEQIYFSSLEPRAKMWIRLLETLT
jgi:glutamate carboxypeptidase